MHIVKAICQSALTIKWLLVIYQYYPHKWLICVNSLWELMWLTVCFLLSLPFGFANRIPETRSGYVADSHCGLFIVTVELEHHVIGWLKGTWGTFCTVTEMQWELFEIGSFKINHYWVNTSQDQRSLHHWRFVFLLLHLRVVKKKQDQFPSTANDAHKTHLKATWFTGDAG